MKRQLYSDPVFINTCPLQLGHGYTCNKHVYSIITQGLEVTIYEEKGWENSVCLAGRIVRTRGKGRDE